MRYTLLAICFLLAFSVVTWADPDLVIYYSFDQFSATVPDLSGKGNDAIVVGDVKPEPVGKRGGAAKFTKTDAGSFLDLDTPNMAIADIPRDAITVCVWLKGTEIGDLEIFSPRSGTVNSHAELRADGTIRWILRSNENVTLFEIRNGKWTLNEWVHFAGLYDSASKVGALYLNGELVEEKAATGDKILDWSAGARLGMTVDNARPFIGLMDDACIYKRSLSQAEIKAVMDGGPQVPSAVSSEGSITTTWGRIKY